MRKSIIFLFVFLFIICHLAFSQTISSQLYETEEDLEEGLLSGELTYQEYLELLELLTEGVSSDSSEMDRLLFLPDLTQSQLEYTQDSISEASLSDNISPFYPVPGSFFLPEIFNQAKGRISFQTRQRFDQDYSYNFILTEFKLKNKLLFNLQLQKENTSSLQIRKRKLEFYDLPYMRRIVLGNFEKKIGLGLNIGYHPLLKVEEQAEENDFLYPLYGRYNGILIESKFDFFNPELILSKNRRGYFTEELQALNLSLSFRNLDFGLLRSEGRLRNSSNRSSFYDRNTSLYLKARKEKLTFSGEYSFLHNKAKGCASVLTVREKPFVIELSGWSYSQDYLHLFGLGLSNPDYTTIKIDEIEYEYPSREIGEKGVLFKSRYNLYSDLVLDFSFSQWKESPGDPFKLRHKIGLEKALYKKTKTRLEYYYSDSDLEEEGKSQKLFSSTFLFEPYKDILLRLITRYGTKELSSSLGKRESFEQQFRSDLNSISPVDIYLWVKYKDNDLSESGDGYWDLRIKERVSFFKGSFLWGEYFIQLNSAEKDKVRGAKLRLEVGF
jgi:hypothetical protein